jgi:hypothetical protein
MSKTTIYLRVMPKAAIEITEKEYRGLCGPGTEVWEVCENAEVVVLAVRRGSVSTAGRYETIMHAAMTAAQARGVRTGTLRAIGRFAPRKQAVTPKNDPSKYDRTLL